MSGEKTVATPEQIADEALRARKVRQIVDIASSIIMQSNMARQDADTLVRWVREQVLSLFPDGEQTYELVYASRLRRLIDEFANAPDRGFVVPFARPRR